MKYEITGGKIQHARKVLVYGPEGVGKSTFASHFPDPLFIDTEGSTRNLDVKRMPTPTSWPMLIDEVMTIANERPCKTLVIDTLDWAERMCAWDLCQAKGWNGIEDAGYGKGYTYLAERFGQLLNRLEDVVQAGINVVVTAHAKISKFEQPDEMGTYDRWELKLEKKTAPMAKEWADMILFANYQTIVVKSKDGKSKGQGGQKRVMYTTHTATWDAKNRDDLPDKLDFDYNQIAHLFTDSVISKIDSVISKMEKTQAKSVAEQTIDPDPLPYNTSGLDIRDGLDQEPPRITDPEDIPVQNNFNWDTPEYKGIPKALLDLMKANEVYEEDIRKVVAMRGYFPEDMPVKEYPKDFIDGVLIGAWDQVYQMIKQETLPF